MTLDGKILRGLFKHKGLKPAIVRTSQGNIHNLSQLKSDKYRHNSINKTILVI